MTPDTVHFIAQMIRHNRAQITTFEKWLRTQRHSSTCRELFRVLDVWRNGLNAAERELEGVPIDGANEQDVSACLSHQGVRT